MRRTLLALVVTAAAAVACGAATPPPPSPDGDTPPSLVRCLGAPFTPAPDEAWIHSTLTPLVTALGAANHSMQDVLSTTAAGATIHGKFSYGAISKDLEDEKVRVFLDACSGWTTLGDFRTDSDGRISVPLPAGLAIGVHEVRLQVLGDGTSTTGHVWILPAGTHLAVSDIDGTLTTSDEEFVTDVITDFFEPIFSGNDVPDAYPGAAALTNALVGRGYALVYLTGRPYWLTGKTRDWLSSGGFALGALHVTDSNEEAIPSAGGVGAFKLAYLRSLTAAGFVLDEAYGNATTDVSAYAGAGIPATSTWIIGPNAGAGGTQPVTGSWGARAAAVSALPEVVQPFSVSLR